MNLSFKLISRRKAGRSYIPKEDLRLNFSLEQNSQAKILKFFSSWKKHIWFQVYVFGNLTARVSFHSGETMYPQHLMGNEAWEAGNRQGGCREGKGRKEACEGL